MAGIESNGDLGLDIKFGATKGTSHATMQAI